MPISVPAATSDAPLPGPTDDQATAPERTADARLARVHLRGGMLTLSRAALEGMAGAGTLDREAMADLAEARWRSGDVEGAAEAARAHQASGGDEPIALLIMAEDLARGGQEVEAAAIATAVGERVDGAVEQLFAFEPRSHVWPPMDEGWMSVEAAEPGRFGLLVGGSEVAAPSSETWRVAPLLQPPQPPLAPAPGGRGGLDHPGGATSAAAVVMSGLIAGEELETVEQSVSRGDISGATQRLAVLLRLDPALAPIILSAADRTVSVAPLDSRDLPALHLVRGDAYRALGRDNEAAAAYQAAHQALGTGPSSKEPT
ncbi:MAG: hypothetical protein PVG27_06420 [Chloroflexota bacterium]